MTETNSRVAALILAHKDSAQLARLIERLAHPNLDVHLHLDRKWNLGLSELEHLRSLNEGRVYIAPIRQSVELFSWTMVDATLELLRQALAHGAGQFILLSGQDYPIKPVDRIIAELQTDHPDPSIDCTMWHEGNWVATSFSRVYPPPQMASVRRAIERHIPTIPLRRMLRGSNRFLFRCASLLVQSVHGTPLARMTRMRLQVAGGSQWWILPDDMVAEVLLRSEDRHFVSVFRDVGSPDETFFQSTLVNSIFADRLTINRWEETKQITSGLCLKWSDGWLS